MTLTGPVCDAGRCSQVLAAFASVRQRALDAQAATFVALMEAARDDAELKLDERQRQEWPAVMRRAIAAATGEVAA